ncbi:MAG: sorbitol dehydrogenase [Candidatus Binatia bacterium]|nr:MAG: sorbitol dehydrogenase [Candidatus Binatia bacterium]
MRAQVVLEPGRMELREVETPRPGEGEVLLRVRRALTCGTDVKTVARGHPKFPMPTRLGHEYSGEVAAVGRGVRNVREGDSVMLVPSAPCGQCFYCARGDENLCETLMEQYAIGGFAEFVLLPARVVRTNLFPKPRGLGYEEAALLEPLSCVVHGLEMVPIRPDWCVVIVGAGAISALHLLALRARGVSEVLVVGRGERRLAHVRAFDPTAVFGGGIAAARPRVLRHTGGRGADVVVECTGQAEVWAEALSLVRPGGWLVLFGGCAAGSRVSFDTQRIHYDQIRIVSPFHFTPRAVRKARELLVSGAVAADGLLAEQVPLEDVPRALARQSEGHALKYSVAP